MNFSYIDNITLPACLIKVSSNSIYYLNDKARELFTCCYGGEDMDNYDSRFVEIAKLAIERIGENDETTFSYSVTANDVLYKMKFRMEYVNSEKEYIMAVIYTDMDNYISALNLSVFAETVPGGLMLAEITQEGEYIANYVNSGILNMHGYTRKECKDYFSHKLLNFIYPKDIEKGMVSFNEQLDKTGEFQLDGRLMCKNGSLIWVRFNGKLVSGLMGRKWMFCTITNITKTQELLEETYTERQIYNILEKISKDVFFKYDIKSKIMSFYGFPVKKIFGTGFVEYSKKEIIEGRTEFGYHTNEISSLFYNMERNMVIPETYMTYDEHNEPTWFRFDYGFIHDKQGNVVSAMGQVRNVTAQKEAKFYYDKAIALWSKKGNSDKQVSINLTENIVIDGNESSSTLTAEEYFSKTILAMMNSDEKEDVKKKLTRKYLIQLFSKNITHYQFDAEFRLNNEYHWMRAQLQLVENPMTQSIIALMTWKNINDIHFQNHVNNLLLADTYDFICCIFTKTDSYMMIQNIENTKLIPNSIACGYSKFIDSIIDRYVDSEEIDYLKFCFSIKNLIGQLKINDSYTFIGRGTYPDGTPAEKLNYFTYLDKKKGIILYTRKDISNQGQRFSFQINGTIYSFDYTEIICIESFGRKCEITTTKDSFMVNESISSIQERLPGKLFTRCHRSYIVNNTFVTKIEKNYAFFKNGKQIPINKQSMNFIRNKLLR